ncbi:MAG: hypothetical protein AB7G88_08790 [Thermomicrobiales bacterium]
MDGVIVEATHVLSSDRYFAGSRGTIAEGIRTIIGLHGMTVQHRAAHSVALEIFAVSTLITSTAFKWLWFVRERPG